jgi:hypothetical protein
VELRSFASWLTSSAPARADFNHAKLSHKCHATTSGAVDEKAGGLFSHNVPYYKEIKGIVAQKLVGEYIA